MTSSKTKRRFTPPRESAARVHLVRLFFFTPSCLGRGTGREQGARRWEKREMMPNATLSPPQ